MAALARSSAASGSTAVQTAAGKSPTEMLAPNRLACVVTSLAARCHGGRRSERRLEVALEILLPDRLSGLLRCPRREGAPVGNLAEARRRRGRKLVIGPRDLEVADHRIGDGRDPINVLRRQWAAREGARVSTRQASSLSASPAAQPAVFPLFFPPREQLLTS